MVCQENGADENSPTTLSSATTENEKFFDKKDYKKMQK